jgi:osmoprotectant transport system permease protein
VRRYIVLITLLALCVAATVVITNMEWVKEGVYKPFPWGDVLNCTRAHLKMVLIAEAIAIAIGVPLGILVTRPSFKRLSIPVIGGANVGQSVPSLAVIAIMAPILGFGFQSAIVALVIYGLLPILRNSYSSINNIDPSIVEAARGMGMTRGQIARKIELPLALPVIMAGIRISTVITVGTAELAVLVGGAGLGRITLSGVFSQQVLIILQGAAPTAALAITLGFVLARIESWLTSRGLKIKAELA